MNIKRHFAAMPITWVAAALVGLGAYASAAPVQASLATAASAASANPAGTRDSGARMLVAAEAIPVAEKGPDQAASPPAKPDTADPKVADRQAACKKQWEAVDTNHDGVLADGEIQRYNDSFRDKSQPVLADSDRLTQEDFVKTCLTLAAHE